MLALLSAIGNAGALATSPVLTQVYDTCSGLLGALAVTKGGGRVLAKAVKSALGAASSTAPGDLTVFRACVGVLPALEGAAPGLCHRAFVYGAKAAKRAVHACRKGGDGDGAPVSVCVVAFVCVHVRVCV